MTAERSIVEVAELGPGIAWAFDFDEYGRARVLPTDQPVDFQHGRRFVWLHVALANARSRDWIRAQDAIDPEARELLLSQDSHPRVEWRGDRLWGTIYDIQYEPESASDEPTDLRFVLTPQYLLTARHHAIHSAHRLKRQIDDGAGFESSGALLEAMFAAVADSIGSATQRISVDLDSIEDRVLSETLFDDRAPLLKLRRTISRQNRVVHAIRSVLERLEQPRAEGALEVYRALAARVGQRIAALQADVHVVSDRARMLQDEMAAQLATATNRNLFILTIVTTILLPPAFVTGFFGMNTKGLPFGDSDYGTLYAAILCGAAAVFVYLLIRRYRMFA